MSMRSWWLPAVTGLAGLLAGWWLAPRSEAPPASPVTSASATHAQGSSREVSPAAASAVSLEDLRRVVREELAAAGGRPATPGPSTAAAGEPDLPTPAQNAALMRASQLLDSAVARRQWTDADVQAIRAEFHQLTVEQQVEVMRQYAMAVNQGRIVPQTDQVPF